MKTEKPTNLEVQGARDGMRAAANDVLKTVERQSEPFKAELRQVRDSLRGPANYCFQAYVQTAGARDLAESLKDRAYKLETSLRATPYSRPQREELRAVRDQLGAIEESLAAVPFTRLLDDSLPPLRRALDLLERSVLRPTPILVTWREALAQLESATRDGDALNKLRALRFSVGQALGALHEALIFVPNTGPFADLRERVRPLPAGHDSGSQFELNMTARDIRNLQRRTRVAMVRLVLAQRTDAGPETESAALETLIAELQAAVSTVTPRIILTSR